MLLPFYSADWVGYGHFHFYICSLGSKTLLQLDLTTLITQKGIPIGLTHLDSFVRAKQYSETFKTSLNLQGKPGTEYQVDICTFDESDSM